jgi:bifunctional non-homologous end joining protein LigD
MRDDPPVMTPTLERLPGKLLARLRPEPVPDWIAPMLATLTEQRFSDPDWIFERKFDGVRCLAFRDGDRVRLLSRHQQLLNRTYPELVDALAAQQRERFVIDGEVVAFEGRRTSFARLQGRSGLHDPAAARASGIPVFYYLFDLLHLDGRRTTAVPLIWRKRLLRHAVTFTDPLRSTPYRVGAGQAAHRRACERGEEGVLAKRAEGQYASTRSGDWLKFKCVRDQEFVIGGFTTPKGSRVGFGALLVGYYDHGELVYAGKVGTGYDTATLRTLRAQMDPLTLEGMPFTRNRPGEPGSRWVAPHLVAQIAFTEWTRDGKLRHPRFTGLRSDKPAEQVVRESR